MHHFLQSSLEFQLYLATYFIILVLAYVTES